MQTRRLVVVLGVILAVYRLGFAGSLPAKTPGKTDKCPICGMFVYKYPDWLAQIVFVDGRVVFFDGAKDMFKYYFALKRSAPGGMAEQIDSIYVTDYYDLEPVEARAAYFVTGSDVYGPMGKELVPMKNRAAAEEFFRDHGGKVIAVFGEVNPALIKTLD
jgi:nitrous oxide reductase accessory protein NosL